jgi:hypothetical protein
MVFSLGLSQPNGCLVVNKRVELAGRAWQSGHGRCLAGIQSWQKSIAAGG